jgi:hypothetical protein
MSQQEILEQAKLWGMADEHGMLAEATYNAAQHWYLRCRDGSAYAIQIYMVFVWRAVPGVLCMASTAQSCAQDNANSQEGVSPMAVVVHPGWWYFDVYFFPYLAIGNFWGMTQYQEGGWKLGQAWEVFDDIWRANDVKWRIQFAPELGKSYFDSLWRMLAALKIPYFQIITTGVSWKGYRCLDMYQRTHILGMPDPTFESWYVMGLETPWWGRIEYEPQDWYHLKVLHSYGQKECVFNWWLEGPKYALPGGIPTMIAQSGQVVSLHAERRARL